MIHYLNIDLFHSNTDYIIHQANCRGVMGAGLAKQIANRFPSLLTEYKDLCRKHKPEHLLGKCFIHSNVITVFGQLDYGRDPNRVYTDYEALKSCFENIHKGLPIHEVIAFPYRFGCGLANGNWDIVEEIIRTSFPDRTVLICKK